MGILAGACPPTVGKILFRGLDITEHITIMHRMTGFCPQQNVFMNELTALEWFRTLCVLRGEPDFDCSELIAALGLESQLPGRIGGMSGGNKRKVCLASALLGSPAIVILDEATSGVDFTSRTRIWSLIAGLTVIMATHTLEECEKIADRIMVLAEGKISVLETPTELRQMFKCGYLIETDEANSTQLRQILESHGIANPEIEVTEARAKVVIPSDQQHELAEMLRGISFSYLMSIQSLEDKIFSHIQETEMAQVLRRSAHHEVEHEELHPGVQRDRKPVHRR